MSGNVFVSCSTEIPARSFEISRVRRERSSSVRRTWTRWPDLTREAPYSIEATTHAFSMRRGRRGERAGVRAFPS
jgi:hypothetical protein